jgi:hypothetical protein
MKTMDSVMMRYELNHSTGFLAFSTSNADKQKEMQSAITIATTIFTPKFWT